MSEIEKYLTAEEKKEIALRVFEDKLRESFSPAEVERYDHQQKEWAEGLKKDLDR